jgi:hypothetical protein
MVKSLDRTLLVRCTARQHVDVRRSLPSVGNTPGIIDIFVSLRLRTKLYLLAKSFCVIREVAHKPYEPSDGFCAVRNLMANGSYGSG